MIKNITAFIIECAAEENAVDFKVFQRADGSWTASFRGADGKVLVGRDGSTPLRGRGRDMNEALEELDLAVGD